MKQGPIHFWGVFALVVAILFLLVLVPFLVTTTHGPQWWEGR